MREKETSKASASASSSRTTEPGTRRVGCEMGDGLGKTSLGCTSSSNDAPVQA